MHDPEKRKKANPLRQRKEKDAKKDGEAPAAVTAVPESDNLVHA